MFACALAAVQLPTTDVFCRAATVLLLPLRLRARPHRRPASPDRLPGRLPSDALSCRSPLLYSSRELNLKLRDVNVAVLLEASERALTDSREACAPQGVGVGWDGVRARAIEWCGCPTGVDKNSRDLSGMLWTLWTDGAANGAPQQRVVAVPEPPGLRGSREGEAAVR